MKSATRRYSVIIPVVFISLFCSNNFYAQDIFTIDVDTIQYLQEIRYCPGYDSIRLISDPDYLIPVWGIDDDTTQADVIYIPNGFAKEVALIDSSNLSIFVVFRMVPVTADSSEIDIDVNCMDNQVELDATSTFVTTGNLTYSWEPQDGLDDGTKVNPVATITEDIVYKVTISSDRGCTEIRTFNISMGTAPVPEICIVDVNEDNKNVVYFDKAALEGVDSIYVYKETIVTDNYEKIGAVDFEAPSFFVDPASNPVVQANKYLLRTIDLCDQVSEGGEPHKTMHLSILQGQNDSWILIWENYEGFVPSTYYIYRGTTPDNLELIGTSTASNTQYSDFTAPAGYVYYQIEIVKPGNCISAKKSISADDYVISRSNMSTNNKNPFGINDVTQPALITVYPNPTHDLLTITTGEQVKNGISWEIHDSSGKKIRSGSAGYGERNIDVSYLDQGLYIFSIRMEDGSTGHCIFVKD